LNIFLSVLSMLFLIGLVVFVFVVAGNKLHTATEDTNIVSIKNLTTAVLMSYNTYGASNPASITGLTSTLPSCSLSITAVTNATSGTLVTRTNYSASGCKIYANAGLPPSWNNSKWNVTGTYTYTSESSASQVINDTITGMAEAPQWFSTFIVLGAMVVLILLIVLIINSIRQTGIIGGEGGA